MTSSPWLRQIFEAHEAQTGGVVRRHRNDVQRFSSLDEVVAEARRHRFHVIESGDQVIVLCHEGGITVHC